MTGQQEEVLLRHVRSIAESLKKIQEALDKIVKQGESAQFSRSQG